MQQLINQHKIKQIDGLPSNEELNAAFDPVFYKISKFFFEPNGVYLKGEYTDLEILSALTNYWDDIEKPIFITRGLFRMNVANPDMCDGFTHFIARAKKPQRGAFYATVATIGEPT